MPRRPPHLPAPQSRHDGARIAEISQAMHARQKGIDRRFDALDRATREHEGLSTGFGREAAEIEAVDKGMDGK